MTLTTSQYSAGRTLFRSYRIEALICLCIVVVTLSAYGQVRHHDFIDFDDDIYVSSNRYVRNGLTIDGVKWSLGFNNEHRTYWHPLTWLSHMTDVQIFGINAGGSLATNVFLHLLNSLLLFFILRRWTSEMWPAALAVAIFAIHPIGVESVAWVASRKNLLSSFFWFLTMFIYGRYTERPGPARYLAVVLCFIFGLMAKPMLVTLPCVLLLMDIWPLGRWPLDRPGGIWRAPAGQLIAEKIPLLALSVLSIGLSTSSLQGHNSLMPYGAIPMGLRISNALVSYVAYIGKLFWPLDLSVYYPFPKIIPLWQPVGALVILMGISLLVWRMRREKPFLIVGWFWYLGTLIPVIGLVQAGLWPAMADRFAYIPFVGLYVMIAWGCFGGYARGRHSRALLAFTVALMMILAVKTWNQTAYWKNSITLFGHAIELNGNNLIARNNIGKSLIAKGQTGQAVEHYRVALDIHPNYVSAHKNLGAALAMQGNTDEGITYLLGALRLDPSLADAHYNLGKIYAEQGRLEEAIQHYVKAIDSDPEHFEAHNNLANLLAEQGRLDLAVRHFKRALNINPHYAEAHNNLGTALYRKSQVQEAIKHYRSAIDILPDYAEAHNNLGVALKKMGRVDRAMTHYKKALQLQPEYSEAHFNLGLALAKLGKIETAIVHYEMALRFKPDNMRVQLQFEKSLATLSAINTEIETLNGSIASNPSAPQFHLELGDLYIKKGDTQSALASYRMALTHDKAFVPAYQKLGMVYAKSGEFDQAIHAFYEISRLDPQNVEACYWLAGLYAVQKQTDEALMWLEKAIARGYSDWDRINYDPKFRNIRGTPGYQKLSIPSSS